MLFVHLPTCLVSPTAGCRSVAVGTRGVLVALWCAAAVQAAFAQPNAATAGVDFRSADRDESALLDRSLAELMSVEVVSASRQRVALGDTGAALFVITQEDIVRSGARVLPEVLRLAPGVDVARISSGRWAVGVRGDTSRFSGGLQVLLDGRSNDLPYFSGMFWDVEQVPLADSERVEIVRGPAGAIWGPNAVNGVINIITFNARDTLGTRLESLADSDGQHWVHLRHGAATDGAEPNNGAWRLSARASETSSYQTADGRDARDRNRNVNFTGRLGRRLAHGELGLQFQALQAGDRDEWVLPYDRPPAFNDPTSLRLSFRRLMASGVLSQRLADQGQLQVSAGVAHEGAELAGFPKTQNTTAELQAQHQVIWANGTRVPGRDFQDAPFSVYTVPVLLPGIEPAPASIIRRALLAVSTETTAFGLGSRWRLGERFSVDLTAFTQRCQNRVRFRSPNVATITRTVAGLASSWEAPIYLEWIDTAARTSGVEMAADWHIRSGLRSQLAVSALALRASVRF